MNLQCDKTDLFVRTFKARHPTGIKLMKEGAKRRRSLTLLAKELGFSKAYASTAFKKLFKVSYSEYLKDNKK